MVCYLHKLLQLKYPVHVNAITMSRAEELLHEHCSIALDYQVEYAYVDTLLKARNSFTLC